MNNQKQHWNTLQKHGDNDHYSGKPTDFAKEVLSIINPASTILELGCGVGNDAVGFAAQGHTVVATDFSDVAITKNTKRFQDIPNLTFCTVDINNPLRFSPRQFDVVYARLSLHYFTEKITRRIFKDIYTLLKPTGYLCFLCKSTNDPLYGKGINIEPDMFENDGHVRHFFSQKYTKSLLEKRFTIETIKTGIETFYTYKSAFIQVIARAI